MTTPVPIIGIDQASTFAPISVAAGGTTAILDNSAGSLPAQVYELYLWAVAANTVQVALSGVALTGVYDLLDHNGVTVIGVLIPVGKILQLVCGGAAQIVGHIRYRQKP